MLSGETHTGKDNFLSSSSESECKLLRIFATAIVTPSFNIFTIAVPLAGGTVGVGDWANAVELHEDNAILNISRILK
jgi:hypothetical protein